MTSTDGEAEVRVALALPGMKVSASPKLLVDVDKFVSAFLIAVLLVKSSTTGTGAVGTFFNSAITLSCSVTMRLNSLT